jgi:signal transduction histidine kinase
MIWIAVAYGLRPLVRITQDLRKRSHRDLRPLDVSRLPPDVAPLAEALNDLMGRLAAIIDKQRTFIADAAHELLTPLTALRLQAQPATMPTANPWTRLTSIWRRSSVGCYRFICRSRPRRRCKPKLGFKKVP